MAAPPQTDRCVGQLLHLPLPPHHNPAPSLPRSDSASSAASFASAASAAPNSPAVPRSSSFTRSRRFLTGDGLSAREALGLLDFDDDVSATGDPDVDAAALSLRFQRARESIHHLFHVAPSVGLHGGLVRQVPPPPPPPPSRASGAAPVGAVLLRKLADVTSLEDARSKHVERHVGGGMIDEYAALGEEDERWQDPADNDNEEPTSSEDAANHRPATSAPQPFPQKLVMRPPPPLSSRLRADALQFASEGVSLPGQSTSASNPPSDVSSETEPQSPPTTRHMSLAVNKEADAAPLLMPSARRPVKNVQFSTEEPTIAVPEATVLHENKDLVSAGTMPSDMAPRRNRLALSPGHRRRRLSHRMPSGGTDTTDDDVLPSGAVAPPPKSKTVARLREMFASRLDLPEGADVGVQKPLGQDGSNIRGCGGDAARAVMGRPASAELKSARKTPVVVRRSGSPHQTPLHELEFNDVADAIVLECPVVGDDASMFVRHDVAEAKVGDTGPSRVPAQTRAEDGGKVMAVGGDISAERGLMTTKSEAVLPSDAVPSEKVGSGGQSTSSEDARSAATKEIVRRRMGLFKRFKVIQENAKFDTSPKIAEQLPAEVSGISSPAPVHPTTDIPTPSHSTRMSSNMPRKRVAPMDHTIVGDDNVSFLSANEDFASVSPALANVSPPRKEGPVSTATAGSSPRHFPRSSPTVESLTTSSGTSKSDRFCAHPGAVGANCASGGLASGRSDGGSSKNQHALPTSQELTHFGLPHTLTGSVSGVNAHSFLDGPVAEPRRTCTPTKGVSVRRDSHTAFVSELEGKKGASDSTLIDPARSGEESSPTTTASPKRTSEMKKTVSGLQRHLAKARDAGAGIVAKAKKLPRGASFSRLRSGEVSQDSKAGPRRAASLTDGRDEHGPRMAASRFAEEPSEDGPYSVRNEAPLDLQADDFVAPGSASHSPALNRSAKRNQKTGAKHASSRSPVAAKEAGSSTRPRKVANATAPAKAVESSAEYVTIQRVIRRVKGDGTEDVVRKRIRVKPEAVLANGDVVVRRTMNRTKDDGTGVESLTVMQVIPRRRRRSPSKGAPGKSMVKEAIEPVVPAVQTSVKEIAKRFEAGIHVPTNVPPVEFEENLNKRDGMSERALSLPSVRSVSVGLARNLPSADGVRDPDGRRASHEALAGESSSFSPHDNTHAVVMEEPLFAPADTSRPNATIIKGEVAEGLQHNKFQRVRSGKVGRAKSGSPTQDARNDGSFEETRGLGWPWSFTGRGGKAGRGLSFQGREDTRRERRLVGLWKKSS